MTTSTAPESAPTARTLYRTAQVRARDVVAGDIVLDGRAWREVLGVAHTPQEAAAEWSWTPMAQHSNDDWPQEAADEWSWTPMAQHSNDDWPVDPHNLLPEEPRTFTDTAWVFPRGVAGRAMTQFQGANEYVAIRLLGLSSGEVDDLTMLAPATSLITVQVPEGTGLGQ